MNQKRKNFVASPGTFGSLPTFTTEIYLGENKNVGKQGYYPIPSEFPQELADKSKKMPVFIFFPIRPNSKSLLKPGLLN